MEKTKEELKEELVGQFIGVLRQEKKEMSY